MNDHDIQTAYRSMERALTPTPEAITAVQRAVASRQRTRLVILGLATLAVAAGVTSAAIGLSGALEPGPNSSVLLTEPGQAGTTVHEAPTAPDGMRFVGVDNLVVAVPAHWSTNDVHCGQPLSDTVYYHSDGQRACLVPGEQHPATLAIAKVSSAFGEAVMQDAHPTGELGGMAIWKTDVTTVDDNDLFQQAVGVPDLNVLFVATAPSRSAVEAIVESLRLLPDGYITVPFDPYWRQDLATTLREAGLHVQVTKVERPELSGGTLVALRPPPGSVIRVGDSVTLTLAAGSSPDKPPGAKSDY